MQQAIQNSLYWMDQTRLHQAQQDHEYRRIAACCSQLAEENRALAEKVRLLSEAQTTNSPRRRTSVEAKQAQLSAASTRTVRLDAPEDVQQEILSLHLRCCAAESVLERIGYVREHGEHGGWAQKARKRRTRKRVADPQADHSPSTAQPSHVRPPPQGGSA